MYDGGCKMPQEQIHTGMKSFRDWINLREQGDTPPAPPAPIGGPVMQPKTSKPSKTQILDYWRALQPSRVIPMEPMEPDHKGSTYSQDGIRVTGSRQFVDGVLSRLKDLVALENEQSKLEIVYREIDSPKNPRPGTFVFYIMAKQRTAPRRKVAAVQQAVPTLGAKPKVPKMEPPKLP
jgi:hypothetical protein